MEDKGLWMVGSGLRPEDSTESLQSLHNGEEQRENYWADPSKPGGRIKSSSMSDLDDDSHLPDDVQRSRNRSACDLEDTPQVSDNLQNSPSCHLLDRSGMKRTMPSLTESGFMTGPSCAPTPCESMKSVYEQKNRENSRTYPRSVRIPLWLIVGFIMIVSIIIVVLSALLSSGAVLDPRPAAPPCEDSWIWVNGRCYYFSETTNTWNNSRDFCTEHGSTLAVLIDQEIKKVIDRYRENVNYWIGLSMDHNGQWIWTNGSRYNGSVDNQDSRHLRCAFLNSHLGALHCSTPRQWICVQDST